MNKNISSEKLKQELSKNFEQTNLLTKSALKPHLIVKELSAENDETPEKQRVLELKIPLNSWSPKYELFKGFSYREKIDINAFDAETPIESQDINSYLDHKMSIENLLASTKNKSMSVEKSGEEIIAKIKVDESDDKLKKVANLISDGIVESNSFIFKSEEVDYIEHFKDENSTSEVDLEIIYKKGKLISIDPVYEGFFPQAKCQVYDKNNNNFSDFKLELKNLYEPKQEKEIPNMEQKELLNAVETVEKEDLKIVDTVEKEAKVPSHLMPEARANVEKARNLHTGLLSRNTKLTNYDSLKTKFMRGQLISSDNDFFEFSKRMWSDFVKTQNDNPEQATRQLWNDDKKAMKIVERALDGTSSLKGLALVENILQPGILGELTNQFPEFSAISQKIPLTGLNTISKAVYIPDNKTVAKVAEGAKSTEMGGQTFNVILNPNRYSVKLNQNNALTHGPELWEKQTLNARNRLIKSLRSDFYDGLFTHAGVTLASLVPTTASSKYSGGVSSDAKIESLDALKFSFHDMDNMLEKILADYGQSAMSNLVFAMNPETILSLEKAYKDVANPLMLSGIYNQAARTFRGIPIILANEYPDKPKANGTWEANKKPVVLFDKESVVGYGLNFTIIDDPYGAMDEDQTFRYVRTRGEIKLCDPNVSTRFIQIKAS